MGGDDLRALPDEILVKIFQATGDHDHFSEIFRRYKKSVYAGCMGMLRTSAVAEELTQETFLRLFTRIETFQGGSFRAWIHRVARNLCLNYLAAAHSGDETLEPDDPAFEQPRKSFEAQLLLADEVQTILNELPAHQRIAMKLFYLDGHSYREIGESMGLAPEQVKSFLQNGTRQFRIRWQGLQRVKGHSNEP